MKRLPVFFVMYGAFFIYSLSGIFSKIASRQEFLSPVYLLCLAAMLCIMALYALLWQKVLEQIPLSVAMSQKPLVLLLGFLWSFALFKETISIRGVAGIACILLGIAVIGKAGNES
ncbi:MAG TPA: hypothetical protein DDW78_06600 [Treponema sp.]|nr:hypothetical protein [Treponema sp.]